ncbi:hypothetical protein KVR01_011666 [Diaporthe batatas]|uniref:uncharacterized protein n=1 Tax=Diaporthe batatas TaxID=748121 RepID=UPI001D05855E|nr:uncharacterized protein KVR01_011666 [Diaporthe batatas]KAG8158544.1 hypothetical protein KVR01_011666 [Diaporthe batatas]
MRFFLMVWGILLALLGVVSATPAPTPATPDQATRVIIGPRRHGYSDLPSSVLVYNAREPANAIPQWVTASDPTTGEDAIIYNRNEIYNALWQGYETLQRTRDTEPGEPLAFGNVLYPAGLIPGLYYLEDTHYGRYGESVEVDLYMWPLLWTNGYTGHNQNPGDDRVVFNADGVYLGVITRRPTVFSLTSGGGYRWCPPSNVRGQWVAQWIGGTRGWDYTGVPGDGAELHYVAPNRWNVADSQRSWWWRANPGGHPPTGSHDKMYNSSVPEDYNNPLDFPPADNSTGVWQTYVPPSNTTANLTHEFAPFDCQLAFERGAGAYHQSCQTHWEPGSTSMLVRITISGTGQSTTDWCRNIIYNMHDQCGDKFSLVNHQYACDYQYPGTATFSKVTDPKDPEYLNFYFGIDMHFYLAWPWAAADSDHKCMAEAVEMSSCLSAGVKSRNGKWCRSLDWKPDTPVMEWSDDMGPA